MRTLIVAIAFLVPLFPGIAAGQAIPPATESPMQLPVETPPPFLVAQGPADFPAPPPGGPRLTPGGPAGPGPFGTPRSTRMMLPRPGAWWKDSEIVKKLELSEAQSTRIEQAYLAHRLRLVDLRADLEKQELGLQPLLDVDRPDEAKVGGQVDLVTSARGKLEKEHALMLLAIRRVLSVEQWKRLQAFQPDQRLGSHIGPAGAPPGGPGFAPPQRPSPDVPR